MKSFLWLWAFCCFSFVAAAQADTARISLISVQKTETVESQPMPSAPAAEKPMMHEKSTPQPVAVVEQTAAPKVAAASKSTSKFRRLFKPDDNVEEGQYRSKIALGLGIASIILFIGSLAVLSSTILSVAMPWLVLLSSALGVAAVILGIRSRRLLGTSPGKTRNTWAIVLGTIGALLPVLFMAMIILALRKMS